MTGHQRQTDKNHFFNYQMLLQMNDVKNQPDGSGFEHGMVIRSMADQMVQKLIENQVEKSLVEASSTDQNDDPFL